MKKITLLFALVTTLYSSAQNIITVAGTGTQAFNGDGIQATSANLYYPDAVIFDAAGNMYVTDNFNNRIRKINTSGVISTIAGNGTAGYSGDGGAATSAEISHPVGLTFDATGNLFIADRGTMTVRKVSTSGIITTVAGNGQGGYSGDGGQATATELYEPYSIAFDPSGNMYIADFDNNRIRMVNTSGIISTIAGTGTPGFNSDGIQATAAELSLPSWIIFDKAGNLLISDNSNNRIREINTSGIINTIAGNGAAGFSGDGGSAATAELYGPSSVDIDGSGNIYILDAFNNRIRKINTSGTISTIAGNGTASFSGDGGAATAAELQYPFGLTLDAFGNVYFGDEQNNRIREIVFSAEGINDIIKTQNITVYPNPASDNLNLQLNGINGKVIISLYTLIGQKVISENVETAQTVKLSLAGVANGMYLVKVRMEDGSTLVKKVVVTK